MRTETVGAGFGLPNFRGLRAFFETELWVQLHEGIALVSSILVQAVLLIFVRILAPGLWSVAILGALVFSFFTLGQRVLNEAAYIRVDHKLNELYLASPLTPESYFLGMSLGVLVAYFPPILVLAVLAVLTVPLTVLTWFVLPAALLAVWLFSSSLGYVLSTRFHDMRAIWSYASLLYNFFGVLPPVFYPIALVPANARLWVLLLPPSGAASLVQWTLNHSVLSGTEAAVAALALAGESVGLFLFAVYWARRTVRED
ncbi:MAG: ABC transporter permease [Thermoplasmata archaeon]|nr:ABC transporter permease [Thermoplasmata archaeon]